MAAEAGSMFERRTDDLKQELADARFTAQAKTDFFARMSETATASATVMKSPPSHPASITPAITNRLVKKGHRQYSGQPGDRHNRMWSRAIDGQ